MSKLKSILEFALKNNRRKIRKKFRILLCLVLSTSKISNDKYHDLLSLINEREFELFTHDLTSKELSDFFLLCFMSGKKMGQTSALNNTFGIIDTLDYLDFVTKQEIKKEIYKGFTEI